MHRDEQGFDENHPLKPIHKETHYNIYLVSSVYPNEGVNNFPNFDDYDSYQIEFGDINQYKICSMLGSGKFSTVYLGKGPQGIVAIKVLKNYYLDYLKRELKILDAVKSCPNVVQIYNVVQDPVSKLVSIIMEYKPTKSGRVLFPNFTLADIRYYMYQLLLTLDSVHSLGIMHRDVKPGNILWDHENHTIRLIDWGLADIYIPKRQYSPSIGTTPYKAPELILNYRYYNYAVDIWAAGITFAEMLCRYPFFDTEYLDEVLRFIAQLWSTGDVLGFAENYGIYVASIFMDALPNISFPGFHLEEKSFRDGRYDPQAYDLLKKMLIVDPRYRITARDALAHPFFDQIRDLQS